MGLLQNIFGKRNPDIKQLTQRFGTFTDYSPVFTTYAGGVYELELMRSAIDRFATGCSKLKPEIQGSAKPKITRAFKTSPNEYQTWPQFLYRLATIVECDTTAFVVPSFDRDGKTYTGLWPLKAEFAEIVEYRGEPWVRFHFATGEISAIELKHVCIINKFQYKHDFFGDPNNLESTMKVLDAQNKAQLQAIKDSAKIRFVGKLIGQVQEGDMTKKRERFAEDNLSEKNQSGLMLYDNTFSDIQQIKPYNYTISTEEMNRIKDSVFYYFGTNDDILQNHYQEDHWNAYYEGKIEPWALQLGEGLSHMLYTQQERIMNRVSFSSNRMQYASSASKRNMIRDNLDRGVFSIDEARDILNMPPLDEAEFGDLGKKHVIRGEYVDASMLNSPTGDADPQQHDENKKDSDLHGTTDFDDPDK